LTLHQPARSGSRSLTLGSSQLGLDRLFKGVQRQVAAEHAAVDEESRSPGEPGPQPELQVLFNLRLVPAAGQARIKMFLIELQTARLLRSALSVQLGGVLGEQLVLFPEFILLHATA